MSPEAEPAEQTEAERPDDAPSWKRHLRFRWSLLIAFTITMGVAIGIKVRRDRQAKARGEFLAAVESGDIDAVRRCIDLDPGLVSFPSRMGRMPLHTASGEGHYDIAALLLDRGAGVDAWSTEPRRPLHWAAHGGHVDVVRLLIDRGADVKGSSYPLTTCDAETARLLIEKGADVNARLGRKPTWLHTACGAYPWPEAGETIRILVEAGADVRATDWNNWTPLHNLLRNRARDYTTQQPGPVLVYASSERIALAKLLIDHGADINPKDRWGATPRSTAMNTLLTGLEELWDYAPKRRGARMSD